MKIQRIKKSTTHIVILVYGLTLLASLLLPFLFLSKTTALSGTSAAWIDNWNLSYGGEVFVSDDLNQDWVFYWEGDPDGCKDKIDGIDWDPSRLSLDKNDDPGDDDNTAVYKEIIPTPSGGCTEQPSVNINLTSPENARKSFSWNGEVLTTTNSGQKVSFSYSDAFDVYVKDGDNECIDTVSVSADRSSAEITLRVKTKTLPPFSGDSARTDELWKSYGGNNSDFKGGGFAWLSQADYDKTENGCWVSEPAQMTTGNPQNYLEPGEGTITGDPAGGSGSVSSNQPSCEGEGGENTWFLCPALRWLDGIISELDKQINELLFIPESYYEAETINQIWSNIRNIAYILLIPTLLIMVIGTALGFQFLDAYTVKRAMPRLFVATIFIALSLPILQILITVVNSVGEGLFGLITSAVGEPDFSLAGLFDPNPVQGGAFTLGLLVGIASLPIWYGFAFFLALSVLLTLGTIFILLGLRQFLIVALIILAPLAILSWIFPGNDKPWKLWWATFWKLLILYPLIMGLLAIGRVFAVVVDDVPGSGLVELILMLVAYIGPFFFIPAAFKYAGGVFANIGGIVNNAEKGLFDRTRNARNKSLAKRYDNVMKDKAFKGATENNLRGRYGRFLQGATMAASGKAGLNPLKARSELRRSMRSTAIEEKQKLMKENEDVNTAMVDDNLARAVLAGGNEQETRRMLAATGRFSPGKELDDAVAIVRRAQRAGSARAVNSAMAVGLAASKTGYDSHSDMYETIARAAGGDEAMERALIADVKKASEGVRPDLASNGYTDSWNALQRVKGNMGLDDVSRATANRQVNAEMRRDSLRKTGAHAMLAGKPTQTVQREMIELGTAFDTAVASGNMEEATEVASEITAYRNAMGSASPEARQHVAMMLDHVGIKTNAVNQETGQAYSTDEQLGIILNGGTMTSGGPAQQLWNGVGPPPPGAINMGQAKALTQEIRTRAGLYDMGGGDRTPEQLRGVQPPENT